MRFPSFYLVLLLILNGCQPSNLHDVECESNSNSLEITALTKWTDDETKHFVLSNGDSVVSGKPLKLEGTSIPLKSTFDQANSFYSQPTVKSFDFPSYYGNDFLPTEGIRVEFTPLGSDLFSIKTLEAKREDTQKKEVPDYHNPAPQQALPLTSNLDSRSFIQNFGVDQGLGNPYVFAIGQDNIGNMWFGSEYTITKYDGEFVTVYLENSELKAGTSCTSILNDSKGNIWFSNLGGDIFKYDGESYTHFSAINDMTTNFVKEIFEDSKGNIWFLSKNQIIKFDGVHIKSIIVSKTYLTADLMAITEDHDGAIWVGTFGDGLLKIQNDTFSHLSEKGGLKSNYINDLFCDDTGKLWIGSENGLMIYSKGSLEYYTVDHGLSNNQILCMTQDQQGDYWIGTQAGGVNHISNNKIKVFNESDGLLSLTIRSVFEDDGGNMWFGTNGSGVSVLKKNSYQFYTKSNCGFPSNQVRTILQDSENRLWFGTNESGLIMYDHHSEQLHTYDIDNGFIHNRVSCIIEDQNSHIWIGTFGGGLCKFDGNKFIHYNQKNGLHGDIIMDILEDKNGAIWVASWEGGLSVIRKEEITNYNTSNGFLTDIVLDLIELSTGEVYMGTLDGGIVKYENEEFTFLTPNEGFPNTEFWDLAASTDGKIMVATYQGNIAFTNDSLYVFTLEEESAKKNLALLPLSDSSYIGGSNSSSFLLAFNDQDLRKAKFSLLSQQEGYKGGLVYKEALLTDGDICWWGTNKGIVAANKNDLVINDQKPEIAFSSIKIENKYYDFHSELDDPSISFLPAEKYETLPHDLELPFKFNDITFNLTAYSKSPSAEILYSYRMPCHESTWSSPDKSPAAIYKNLTNGNHTIEIRAFNVTTSQWSDSISFNFKINPPWWKTWWARILQFLLITFSITGILQLRTLQLRRKQKILEAKISLATKELKDKNKLISKQNETLEDNLRQREHIIERLKKFASVLSHDIKEPARTIYSFSQILDGKLSKKIEGKEIDFLEIIVSSSKRLTKMIDTLYKYSNETLIYLDAFTKVDLLKVVKSVEVDLKLKIQEKNAKLIYDGLAIIDGQEVLIYQLFQNLISNALKYSKKDVHPIIRITTQITNNEVLISIEDNGIGIDEKAHNEIFELFKRVVNSTDTGHGIGLATCKEIVDIHSGKIWLESKVGVGSTFFIRLNKNINDINKTELDSYY